MTLPVTTGAAPKGRSFWDRPEGLTGMIVGAAALGGVGYGLYKVLPILVSIAANTVALVAMLAVLAGLLHVLVFDSTLRNRLWLAYKMLMRAITGLIVRIDPISAMREIQRKAGERLETVGKCRGEVAGQKRHVDRTLANFRTELESYQRRAVSSAANPEEKRKALSRAGRLQDAITRLEKVAGMMDVFDANLLRAHRALDQMHEDAQFDLNVREREDQAVRASHKAWKAVRAVFNRNDALALMHEEALALQIDDYQRRLGEIDVLMTDSEAFIRHTELNDADYAEKAAAALERINRVRIDDMPSA